MTENKFGLIAKARKQPVSAGVFLFIIGLGNLKFSSFQKQLQVDNHSISINISMWPHFGSFRFCMFMHSFVYFLTSVCGPVGSVRSQI